MAKLSIKSEKITPFGGIFHVRELFSRYVDPVIDKVLGLRCTSYGYQYSEIAGSLSSVYFCGGDCVEDVTSHLMPHLSLHPTLRTCSSDTILRGISELATVNTTYTSDTGKSYDFNTATKLNSLLVKVLKNTGQLMAGESYDLDFDHQFIEMEKYDAKMTYKKFTGYSPGLAVIGDLIVGIENRDGRSALGTLCKQRMPTYVSTSKTRWSVSSQTLSPTIYTSSVPGWTAAPAHARLWKTLRSTRSISTSVPTAAAHSTTACWHCVDGSGRR